MAFAKATVRRFCHLGAFLTLLQMTLLATVVAERRPFYIIGNMVNSLYDVDVFLDDGANALQADVTFSQNGRAQYFYHGPPCDCYRVCTRDSTVQDYLNYLRDVTSKSGGKYEGKVALLYLALHTSSISQDYHYQAGADIASKLLKNLWTNVSPEDALNVLLYVSSTAEKKVFKGVLDNIPAPWSDHIGFDFGGLESLTKIGEAFTELNISRHRWQGSGGGNCVMMYPIGAYDRLEAIVDCREGKRRDCDFVDKGYAYNLDTRYSIAREIRLGLDAVITDYPSTARDVIEWNDIARLVRLAGPSDSPWERITD